VLKKALAGFSKAGQGSGPGIDKIFAKKIFSALWTRPEKDLLKERAWAASRHVRAPCKFGSLARPGARRACARTAPDRRFRACGSDNEDFS
jgi:hypothetical protein